LDGGVNAMNDKPEQTPKALRKLKRRIADEELARYAKFWNRPRSAEQLGHDKPVNRQAANDLFGKLESDDSFDYKAERSRN
jgi:hypothetical protein